MHGIADCQDLDGYVIGKTLGSLREALGAPPNPHQDLESQDPEHSNQERRTGWRRRGATASKTRRVEPSTRDAYPIAVGAAHIRFLGSSKNHLEEYDTFPTSFPSIIRIIRILFEFRTAPFPDIPKHIDTTIRAVSMQVNTDPRGCVLGPFSLELQFSGFQSFPQE